MKSPFRLSLMFGCACMIGSGSIASSEDHSVEEGGPELWIDGPANIQGAITNETVMEVGHTQLIAKAIFVEFLLPFEIASILLLVAIVGAVVLAKRNAAAVQE